MVFRMVNWLENYSHEFFLIYFFAFPVLLLMLQFLFWLVLLRKNFGGCLFSKYELSAIVFIQKNTVKCSSEQDMKCFSLWLEFLLFWKCSLLPFLFRSVFTVQKKNLSTLQVSFYMANRQIIMLFLYKAQIYFGNTKNIAKGYSWFLLNFWCNFGFYFLIKLCTKNFKGLSVELRHRKAVTRSMWVTEVWL